MINRRFLFNAGLLILLVSGGAYFIVLNGGEEGMDEMVPIAQEMPIMDSNSDPVQEKNSVNALPSVNQVMVSIADYSYSPKELRIPVGTRVVWTNNDRAKHNVVEDKGEFSGRLLSTGETFEFAFNSKGTFSYFCGPHPWMKATVIVE